MPPKPLQFVVTQPGSESSTFETCAKWLLVGSKTRYEHKPDAVVESRTRKMIWDFPIQTDWVDGAEKTGSGGVRQGALHRLYS